MAIKDVFWCSMHAVLCLFFMIGAYGNFMNDAEPALFWIQMAGMVINAFAFGMRAVRMR